jgi:polar amino acid transport system substrate-binding protein
MISEQITQYSETMRAILEDIRSGEINTYAIPVPELRPAGILVRTAFSAISAGTERAKVQSAEKSLVGKALARPDLVRQVVNFARTNGFRAAYERVQTQLDTLSTMGYSCAGTVIGIGEGVKDFRLGDRVACGGAGYANHSEINWVPANLAQRVPDGISLDAACLTTIGAIATQGLRQAQLSFGETVAVIGAGLVGVLTMQIARAAGCRVIAIDLNPDRVEKATRHGAQLALVSSDSRLDAAIQQFSRYGVDAVIVTAATRSSEPIEQAARILRDRGRVVVVGDVGMGVSRSNMYHKELTLAMSRSYGPGRYDPTYEEGGQDYPVGYVRWTEQRNMQGFLDLLESGSIDISPLLEQRYHVDEGARAYQELLSGRGYTAILEYPSEREIAAVSVVPGRAQSSSSESKQSGLVVGCIGAGGFARNHIFPALRRARATSLDAIATASGATAESARRNFGFSRALTPASLLNDPHINAVFVLSRHESHAHYVADALRLGKAVFVEKPLAVTSGQLDLVKSAYNEAIEVGEKPFLMVGFNRRFAPFTQRVQEFFAGRREPMFVHIRVNAGYLPPEHWTQRSAQGGRVIGEMCHFVDWARGIVNAPIVSVWAAALPDGSRYNRDNIATTLTFSDGSIANLLYLANGEPSVPKEYFEVFCEGSVARLEDFVTLQLTRMGKTRRFRSTRDKGHDREIKLTAESMLAGNAAPISFGEIIEVTQATFSIMDSLTRVLDGNR